MTVDQLFYVLFWFVCLDATVYILANLSVTFSPVYVNYQ